MHENKFARRWVLKNAIVIAGMAAFKARISFADGLLKLSANDATAQGLDYHADAKTVDTNEFPEYEATQRCASCVHFIDAGDNQYGCKLMPGKQVNLNGWCKVWTAKS